MAQKSRHLWIVALLALAALAAWAWRRSAERAIPTVRTRAVARQDIHTGVTTSGKAEPAAVREVRAEISGIISKVHVNIGDRVRAGDPIIQVSVSGLQAEAAQAASELAAAANARRLAESGGTPAQLAELQAQVNQARRVREQAEALLQQSERLAEKGAIARVELEQARQAHARAGEDLALAEQRWQLRADAESLAQADSRLRAARAALELAESRLRLTTVRSSLSGVVYSLPVRVGDFAEVNAVVARVGDTSRLSIRVFVDEPDLGQISLGQTVRLKWDGLPGKQWSGAVERTPAEVESRDNRTGGEVLASVDNASGELLPNTNLAVEIVTALRPGVLAIPREALQAGGNASPVLNAGGNLSAVYVARGERIELRPIETGLMNPTEIEVLKGLAEGDEVVVQGDRRLADGMQIRRAE